MNLTVICVFYPPLNSSAAIQVNHLVEELAIRGHNIEVITPDSSIKDSFLIENKNHIKIIRFKNGRLTDIKLFLRALNEFIMPFRIIYTILKKSIKLHNSDGIIWWSPSIFFTPLVIYLKFISRCNCYLILRDLFPIWSKDLKIIKNKIIYIFFKLFFLFQCYFADIIAVQSKGNEKFIPKKIFFKKTKVETLNNWYTPHFQKKICDIDISKTILKDKKIFIHAGNIGLAQGFEILINVAEKLNKNKNIGFLFIGRGSQFENMKQLMKKKFISNVLFKDQIDNSQIINLYRQCHCGIVILDRRHTTHNIPGKFVSYLHSGLPVLAIVNPKNDLLSFINRNKIGYATDSFCEDEIKKNILKLSNNMIPNVDRNCKKIANQFFDTKNIADQILKSF